jgi:hypothetical protein
VDWPARLDNVIALKLHVQGEIVETDNGFAAIKILQYEFRTAGQKRTLFPSGTGDNRNRFFSSDSNILSNRSA